MYHQLHPPPLRRRGEFQESLQIWKLFDFRRQDRGPSDMVNAGTDGAVIARDHIAAAAAFGGLFAGHFALADELGGEVGGAAVFRRGAAQDQGLHLNHELLKVADFRCLRFIDPLLLLRLIHEQRREFVVADSLNLARGIANDEFRIDLVDFLGDQTVPHSAVGIAIQVKADRPKLLELI